MARSGALLPLLTLASLATSPLVAQTPWPTKGWSTATAESLGTSSADLLALEAGIAGGRYGNVDQMVVVKDGYLIYNQRFEHDYQAISAGHRGALGCGFGACTDEDDFGAFNYYDPGTHPYFQDRQVHTLQSVTKSVAATLVGIALHRGDIADLDAPLLSFFTAYDTSRSDPRLSEATLADLLTMRSGIEWHEQDRPLNETNTTLQLEHSEDWIQFTLNQPMDAAPGEKWVYNSGGSHLMSGIILDATGMTINAYAEQHLFGPLGIDDYHWKKSPQGLPDTEGGLYLEAEQLAKIGLLYLHQGQWQDKRILEASFVSEATARQVDPVNSAGWGYGFQWWRVDREDTIVWAGLGFGGQYLLILPEYHIVGVMNAWNVFGARVEPALPAFLHALIRLAD